MIPTAPFLPPPVDDRPPTSANTAEARALSLISAMERLMALYQEETALLKKRDIKAMLALVERKHLLTKSYDDAVRIISLDLVGLRGLDAELKTRLKSVADVFHRESLENATALRAAAAVAQSVVNIMVNAINKQRNQENGYVAKHGAARPAGYRRGGIPPMAVNQCL
ncbi:flagellar protein FlgN [Azospirillum sp. B4]|uniref:flagellar protein FlgN n=1 Tax=Azospirillum sp. B4 TaxID=95605 RepID=UPI0003469A95|nr:flagellar protein FlgN [Azospirillum sp. B4]